MSPQAPPPAPPPAPPRPPGEAPADAGAAGDAPASAAPPAREGGVLRWFAENHVAANAVMALLLVGGFVSLLRTPVEVFPEIDPRTISVSVPYPGATPYEVEESINRRVEEAINGIEGIERVRSVATEGVGTVTAELVDGVDDRTVLDDVKSAVDQITLFPPRDAEDPKVAIPQIESRVISIAVYGEVPERTLREAADRIRDDLAAQPGITVVDVAGARAYEVAIEVSEASLQRYGLTFREVADAVQRFSVKLGGGSVRGKGGEILLRTDEQAYVGSDFEEIVVRTNPDGTRIRVRDVATVVDGFEDVDLVNRFNGSPAVFVNVFRVGDQSALAIEAAVKEYVAESPLPRGVSLELWSNSARSLRSRMNLLTRNAIVGLVLVFGCLVLFLELKLAFWTTMGIPIAFLGAFLLIPGADVSINMLSLFGLIVVLGVVVDDAIVVGESIFRLREQGVPGLQAAVRGVREVSAPVVIGVLTSVAAFTPLLTTSGTIGQIVYPIPVVVICVLLVSLVESLIVLPAHLGGGRAESPRGLVPLVQGWFRRGLDAFIERLYAPALRLALRWRWVVLSFALASLATTGGAFVGGHVKFTFLQAIDSDDMSAMLSMPNGTAAAETEAAVAHILDAMERTRQEFDERSPPGADSIVRNVSATVGARPFSSRNGPGRSPDTSRGGHVGEVRVELQSGEEREFTSEQIEARWRELVGEIPGVSTLTFRSSALSAGDDVNVELAHADFDVLLAAVQALKQRLSQYQGVEEVADSFEPGKRELRLALSPLGVSAGVSLEDLARQVRQAFYGAEAQRVQRGRDNVKVLVRYPESERQSLADLFAMRVRLPDGTEVPFRTVAEVTEDRGYASIDRTDRRRVVSVTAKVDEDQANAAEVNADLRTVVLPELVGLYPGLAFSFEGEEKERRDSLISLAKSLGVALLLIFALLGAQLRSYVQPLVIMSVIPFGVIGATIGHVMMGYPLSFLSMFGLVALAGVVVNDSLILVDLANRERRAGAGIVEAAVGAASRRLRPIVFTTMTTFFGLAPILLEESVQAQFLIPMAISLAFGLVFATGITLVLVPTLFVVTERVRTWVGSARG